jgi:hypothetical protein
LIFGDIFEQVVAVSGEEGEEVDDDDAVAKTTRWRIMSKGKDAMMNERISWCLAQRRIMYPPKRSFLSFFEGARSLKFE